MRQTRGNRINCGPCALLKPLKFSLKTIESEYSWGERFATQIFWRGDKILIKFSTIYINTVGEVPWWNVNVWLRGSSVYLFSDRFPLPYLNIVMILAAIPHKISTSQRLLR